MIHLALSSGAAMPALGLGVFRASPEDTRAAVRAALEAGYRHIDTASVYGNEAAVGAAIRESGVPRQEVFVTTKLWNGEQGEDRALRAFEESRQRLGLEYVDLYLLHWPVPGLRVASWRALERLWQAGQARAIGVSNFLIPHLNELEASCRVLPHAQQIEIHPWHQQAEVRAWCARRGVAVEAYSPLTKGRFLSHPAISAISARLGKTPAQILLRWGIEVGVAVLPKSTRPERIRENAAIFDFSLDHEAREALIGLDAGIATGWDPRGQP